MIRMTRFALALGFACALAGTASAQEVKFGVGGPITGPNAATGLQMKNGVEQAVEDINAAGGILGKKITVEFGDDVSDPKQGVSVANNFVADGIQFVIGHYNSGVTIPASQVYYENGILEITPASTNPQVTERGMWNIFRTCGRDDQQGRVAGAYILAHFKGKRIAFVNDKTTYGKGLADEALKTIEAGGMHEVLYEGINTGEKDYSALISKIKLANRRSGLFRRPVYRSRPDRAADARSGRDRAADGRRRHHLRRVRHRRRPRRDRFADDLWPRSAQPARGQGDRG